MVDARYLLNEIKTMQAEISTVLLCNPETIKAIGEEVKKYPNVYLIEEVNVEPNTFFVVKDLDLKKALIETYENRKKGE